MVTTLAGLDEFERELILVRTEASLRDAGAVDVYRDPGRRLQALRETS